MLQLKKLYKVFRGNSKGISAIEVIIALAILGIIAVAFLGGLSTSLHAVRIHDERSVAQSLATSQMEYVKSQEYIIAPWSYMLTHNTTARPDEWPWEDWVWDEDNPPLSEDYAGYCVHVQAEEIDGEEDIQKITVTVYHNEDCAGDEVFTLEDYKVNR